MIKNLRKRMSNQKGFTLVELMVVISILGILAAIAIPRFSDSTALANTGKVTADLRSMDSAIAMYQAANGGADPTGIGATGSETKTELTGAGLLAAAPTTPKTDQSIYLKATKTKLAADATYALATVSGSLRAVITVGSTNYVAEDVRSK
ncbi:pilin [Sporomusaceae bacterium FL31]|nr:pilin [Sporomusaceae bacterium FL31]GCE33440.1 pilin [Sporomusaceae bacterium]